MLTRTASSRARTRRHTFSRTAPGREDAELAATIDRSVEYVAITQLGAPLLVARVAGTFWRRLRGLHAVPPLGERDALLIRPCNAVQTFRLSYPIDVVYLDRWGLVLEVVTLAPNRLSRCRGAGLVLEMRAGASARFGIVPGQVLAISSIASAV